MKNGDDHGNDGRTLPALASGRPMPAIERILLEGARGRRVELLCARPDRVPPPRSTLLVVHGHQFPDRPGASGAMPVEGVSRTLSRGWMYAAVSQPGYGASDGPPDLCGPATQAAIRAAFDHLLGSGADPVRSVVWGISRGAVASGCAFAGEAVCPALLILQAGTYDLCAWDDWVEDGAPGGDLETARAIRANQRREGGDDRAALRARSAILALPDTASDVLIVHGARDPRGPLRDVHALRDRLAATARRVELALHPDAGHRLPGGFALAEAHRRWPDVLAGLVTAPGEAGEDPS